MFKRIVPALVATLSLSGIVAAGGLAGAGAPGVCPPDESPTSEPTTTAAELDGRCAIDAEAYVLNYQQGAMNIQTTAMPSGIPIQPTSDAATEIAEPVPPIVIDEPGVLDDNTFVDAGDSLWVNTADDGESTFALDVDTGSFNVAETFLANGYRPEPDSIRVEEWVNAFSYGDPPATDTDLAVTAESALTGDDWGNRSCG